MEQAQLHLPPAEVLKQLNLGFVHIFLNASIACILYTRRLIHWQSACFLSRTESQLTRPQSLQCVENASDIHERFCSADWTHDPDDSTSQAFKVMRRGGHRCADQILEMLVSSNPDARSVSNKSEFRCHGELATRPPKRYEALYTCGRKAK